MDTCLKPGITPDIDAVAPHEGIVQVMLGMIGMGMYFWWSPVETMILLLPLYHSSLTNNEHISTLNAHGFRPHTFTPLLEGDA